MLLNYGKQVIRIYCQYCIIKILDQNGLQADATTTTLHPFNNLFSRTTWVSWYQKGKTSLDLNEARDYRVLG